MSRSLLKNTSIYGIGAVMNKALGFLLIPLYTRFLTVGEYGILALLNLTLQLLTFLFLMGVSTAAMRDYYEPGADDAARRRVYGNALLLLLLLPVLGAGALLLGGGPVAGAVLPALPPLLLGLVVLLALFSPVISLLNGLLRVQRRPRAFVAFQLGFFLLQTVLIVLAVGPLGYGLRGQLGARIAAYAVFWGLAVLLVARHADLRFDRATMRRLLVFGLPLIPFFVFAWLQSSAGRFLLERAATLEAVGVFALAAQFSGLLVLLGNATDNALLPHFYETAGRPDSARPLGTLVVKFVAGFGLLALYTTAAAEPLVLLVADPAYHEAIHYIPLLTLAGWLLVAAKPFTWSLTWAKRTGTLSFVRFTTLLVTLALLAVLLWGLGWGVRGVVAATLGANAALVVGGYLASRRAVPLEFEPRAAALVCTIVVAGAGALHLLRDDRITLGGTLAKLAVLAVATLTVARLANLRLPRIALA